MVPHTATNEDRDEVVSNNAKQTDSVSFVPTILWHFMCVHDMLTPLPLCEYS